MLEGKPGKKGTLIGESQEMVTPEEKLFRVIAASSRSDQDVDELIKKYATDPAESYKRARVRVSKDFEDSFWTKAEAWVFHPVQELKRRPRLTQLLAVGFGLLMIWLIFEGRQNERNFYFYSSPAAYDNRLSVEKAIQGTAPEIKNPQILQEAPQVVIPPAAPPIPEPYEYRLVGVSWDSQGLVAMVEPGRGERARFVRQGDELPGGVKVEQVKEYSVSVSSGDRKWDLT